MVRDEMRTLFTQTGVVVAGCVLALSMNHKASAQPVPYAFSLEPVFGPSSCVLATQNGWSGSASLLFTAPQSGAYTVDGFDDDSGIGYFWGFVSPDYDAGVRIIDQLLASNYPGASTNVILADGEQVLLVAFFNGGYGSIDDCEGDGFSAVDSGSVVATTAVPTARQVPVASGMFLALMSAVLFGIATRRLRRDSVQPK